MRTIQAVARYMPENCGGIHIHLSELMPVLQTYGVECQVAASQDKPNEDTYTYEGISVYRYPVFPEPKSEPNYGIVPHGGFDKFAHWLKLQNADIYHQHQWTPKCGLPHLRLAKGLGMKTVVSVRLPQPICQRQSLMLNGQTACDGKIDLLRCSQCCGVSRSLPAPLIQNLGEMPTKLSIMAGGALRRLKDAPHLLQNTAASFLRPVSIPAFVAARKRGLIEMAQHADRIIVMSQWVYDAMTINGIPSEKLYLLRHGISETLIQERATRTRTDSHILRIGFLGRWTKDKGIHLLVEAVKQLPTSVPIELVIHGVPQDESYRRKTMNQISGDSRIKVGKRLKREEIPLALANFDVLAVPSQWLETGPVVVLEAFSHGLPVVGSDLGGVAEKVHHNVDGLLVRANDAAAWAKAFERLALEPNLVQKLRQGIRPVRTIHQEALDTLALYNDLISGKPNAEVADIIHTRTSNFQFN